MKTVKKILGSAVMKIITGIFVVSLTIIFVQLLVKNLLKLTSLDEDLVKLTAVLFSTTAALLSYAFLFRALEKRKITELSKENLSRHLLLGIAVGVLLQSLIILFIQLFKGFSVESINSAMYLIPPFSMALSSSVFEELLFRGVVFRIVEDRLGTYASIIISSFFFAVMHIGNPNISIPGIALVVIAGLLLASSYVYTRNLWFPIAIHFSWNFTQAAIFGARVSGHEMSKTFMTTEIKGPVWLTGGDFGPEGSVQALILCLAASILFFVLGHKKGNIKKLRKGAMKAVFERDIT